MKRLLLFTIFITGMLAAYGQQDTSRLRWDFAAGTAFLGSGDMLSLHLENAMTYTLTPYWQAELALGYGKSDYGVYVTTSYVQGNLNILLAPWQLTGKRRFKIGTGFSFMNVSDTFQASDRMLNGAIDRNNYSFSVRNSYGINGILEYTYRFGDRFCAGARLFQQAYSNFDLHTGVTLSVGMSL